MTKESDRPCASFLWTRGETVLGAEVPGFFRT